MAFMPFAKVAIVILNWNSWKDTIECLESLSSLELQNFAVVVIDNASKDASRTKLLEWVSSQNPSVTFNKVIEESDIDQYHHKINATEYIYIQSARNGGFAAGNNLGIRLALNAGCEFIWLLNNDTVVEPTSLSALEQCMRKDSMIGMCGSVLRYYDDRNVIQAVGGVRYNFFLGRGKQLGQGLAADDITVQQLAEVIPTYISGASLCLSADFLRDVGLMEESYFLYFEEIDWAVRARPKWKVATAVNSVVYHKEGGSIGTSSRTKRSRLSQYYLNRNLIRFYILRMPWLLPVALVRVLRELSRLLLLREFALTSTTLQALVDGLLMRTGAKKF